MGTITTQNTHKHVPNNILLMTSDALTVAQGWHEDSWTIADEFKEAILYTAHIRQVNVSATAPTVTEFDDPHIALIHEGRHITGRMGGHQKRFAESGVTLNRISVDFPLYPFGTFRLRSGDLVTTEFNFDDDAVPTAQASWTFAFLVTRF